MEGLDAIWTTMPESVVLACNIEGATPTNNILGYVSRSRSFVVSNDESP